MDEYIAVVQMDCVTGEVKQNTDTMIRLLHAAKQEQKQLMLAVFPEMCLYGYDRFNEIIIRCPQAAIEASLIRIAAACIKDQVDAVIGTPHYGAEGVENAFYYLSKTGTIQHVYSKMHLVASERSWMKAGNSYGICQTPLGRAGFLICWDTSFAEIVRLYAQDGADFIIAGAAWETPYERQWELAVCARAFDNGLPVVAANRIGTDGDVTFAGTSLIADCLGNVLARGEKKTEGYCMIEKHILMNNHELETFGSPVRELRSETYTRKHMKFF
ncbi:MAG: carbon-nitrogen hydrolase family protein [Lachnospiraceae bacterium]|nr:carbon-nitrogen hydrolase family protein [Lachnospiraceae bacterium]